MRITLNMTQWAVGISWTDKVMTALARKFMFMVFVGPVTIIFETKEANVRTG